MLSASLNKTFLSLFVCCWGGFGVVFFVVIDLFRFVCVFVFFVCLIFV